MEKSKLSWVSPQACTLWEEVCVEVDVKAGRDAVGDARQAGRSKRTVLGETKRGTSEYLALCCTIEDAIESQSRQRDGATGGWGAKYKV